MLSRTSHWLEGMRDDGLMRRLRTFPGSASHSSKCFTTSPVSCAKPAVSLLLAAQELCFCAAVLCIAVGHKIIDRFTLSKTCVVLPAAASSGRHGSWSTALNRHRVFIESSPSIQSIICMLTSFLVGPQSSFTGGEVRQL